MCTHDARQNNLPPNAPNEYLVHGEFKTGPDSRGFPDTYYFTIAELHAAGLTKDYITSKIQERFFTVSLRGPAYRLWYLLD